MKTIGRFLLLPLVALTVVSCTSGNGKQSSERLDSLTAAGEPLVGATRDEHGCNPSTGETWSQLRQTCLRLFDEGQRLNPTTVVEGEAVISAFVLFSQDSSQVELFLPDEASSRILSRSQTGIFESGEYSYDVDKSELLDSGKVIFKGE